MELMELVEVEPVTRPFECSWPDCSKSFNRKSDLQRHYRIHTNERPYSCVVAGCGKSFIQRSALTVHIRTHTGEKPHSCTHIGCGKKFSDSSSLARHRRIHTGKRPYKCAHTGCTKSFCRKTTMVKHQRRSHQRGLNASEADDCTDEDEESPATPQNPDMQFASGTVPAHPYNAHPGLQGNIIHRAASFGDFSHPMNQYGSQQQYYPHRHSIATGGPYEFHGPVAPESQHPGVHMIQRTNSQPQHPYYVTDQSNPGVATMNTNPVPQYPMGKQHPQMSLEIPYSAAPSMAGSIQNSPSAYSPAMADRSPLAHEGYYGQLTPTTGYSLNGTSPVVEQSPMTQYPQHIQRVSQPQGQQMHNPTAQHHAQRRESQQLPMHQVQGQWKQSAPPQRAVQVPDQYQRTPPHQQIHQAQEQYQRTAAQHMPHAQQQFQQAAPQQQMSQMQDHYQPRTPPSGPQAQQMAHIPEDYQSQESSESEAHMLNNIIYPETPVDIIAIGSIPSYSAMYEPWSIKPDSDDDPMMQMPSQRIDEM
ncbi:hypothetical protein F5B20DRAFT_214049 [Whalleya microplaca]|nr:hypothetical protein F5B20DRAFT_214049 [Whalleya microplaca]